MAHRNTAQTRTKKDDPSIQFKASDFLKFCACGTDENGRTLFHSDRLTAWSLYLLLMLENRDTNGVISYDNNYFEDIASGAADMMSDLELPHVLMYFCNLIDGGLMRMEPGQLVLTLAPSAVGSGQDQKAAPQRKPAPAPAEPEEEDFFDDDDFDDQEEDFDDTPIPVPNAQ